MGKLDRIDEMLLYELAINARVPLNAIAKKYSVSKDTLANHLKKLEKEGVIRGYITRLNMTALGYTFFSFFAKSNGLNPKLNDLVAESLGSIKGNGWIGMLSGSWDIYGGFWIKDFSDSWNVKEKILEKVGEHLLETEYCISIRKTYYNNMGFVRNPEKWAKTKTISQYPKDEIPVKLDKDDIAILQVLESNARASYVEIGERTGIHPSKVQFRMKQMMKKNIILNFRTIFDDKKLGITFSAVTLSFKNYNPGIMKKLEEICDNDPYIGYLGRIVGPFDAWVEFHIPEEKTFSIAERIKTHLADDLRAIEHIDYLEVRKVRYYPDYIAPLKS